jgi:Icc-related predicted phosphoesterase
MTLMDTGHPRTSMRLLCSADLHGDVAVYDWLLTHVSSERVDALVLAGDLPGCPEGFETPEEALRHDASRFGHLLGAIGLPVFYIMGNDDGLLAGLPTPARSSVTGRQIHHKAQPSTTV